MPKSVVEIHFSALVDAKAVFLNVIGNLFTKQICKRTKIFQTIANNGQEIHLPVLF